MQVLLRTRLGPQLRMDFANGFDWPMYNKIRVPAMERKPGNVLVVFKGWDWGSIKSAGPKVLVEEGGARYGVTQYFGPLAVFVRGPSDNWGTRSFSRRGGTGWIARIGGGGFGRRPGTLVLSAGGRTGRCCWRG